MQYACFLEEQSSINPLMKVYSTLLEPLFTSFNSMVDNTSLDSFCKTAHQWFAQNCSLTRLRELATNLVTSPKLEFDVPPGSSSNNSQNYIFRQKNRTDFNFTDLNYSHYPVLTDLKLELFKDFTLEPNEAIFLLKFLLFLLLQMIFDFYF